MKGIIHHTNAERGLYSARLSDGTFSVFELVDPQNLHKDQEVIASWDEIGEQEAATNNTTKLYVYVEDYGLNESSAYQKTFLL